MAKIKNCAVRHVADQIQGRGYDYMRHYTKKEFRRAGHNTTATMKLTEGQKDFARKIWPDKAAQAAGRGSFQIDGKMIDIPIIVRAERLLRRFEAINAREAKTLAAMKG